MTKLEETNEMIKVASKLFSVPMEPDAIVDKNDVQAIALVDIAKSLAVITDGIIFQSEQLEKQNKQLEKIESDLSRLENSYSSKWYRMHVDD
jgi:hypothetical protein